jgi:hypothetical protein
MISRRSFLRVSALGLAGVAVGAREFLGSGAVGMTTSHSGALQLTMRECLAEMVDLTRVYMWAFDTPQTGLRIPGPVIYAEQGAEVVIEVTNALPRPHAFAVPGVVDSGPIAPGETVAIMFVAPSAGTYVYHDPTDEPMSRAMGLAGAFVVVPTTGPTPYSAPTPGVSNLFDDLGTTYHFPGDPWRPERSWNWVFSTVDHDLHERVRLQPDLSPSEFAETYHPTYFMINGKSGYFAGSDPATVIHGHVGEPALIRSVNVGMVIHSPHVHGNHVYTLAVDARTESNVIAHDTWELRPMSTTDVLLPFVRPPDAYPWPPSDPSVWTTDLGGDGHAGMVYPMHCHAELSQLARGSNYPQGAVTHWVLTGDLEDPTSATSTTTTDPTTTTSTTVPATTSTTTTSIPSTSTSTTSTSTSTTSTSTTIPRRPGRPGSQRPPTRRPPSRRPPSRRPTGRTPRDQGRSQAPSTRRDRNTSRNRWDWRRR